MRWEGKEIPEEYIPLSLHLKTLPHVLREQIAKDLLRDSDGSVVSATLFGEEDKGETSKQFSDVERWVFGLDDEFEPVPQADDEFDEVSTQTKSSRMKETCRPSKVLEFSIRVTKEDDDDSISLQTAELASVHSVQMIQIPFSNLSTTTCQEISFEPEHLAIKSPKLMTSSLPVPPTPSKHGIQKRVKKPSSRELPPQIEMKLFEGEDTSEDVEGFLKDWYTPIDDMVEKSLPCQESMKGRRESRGQKPIHQGHLERDIHMEDCQKEMPGLEQPHAKTSSPERSLPTSFSKAHLTGEQEMRSPSRRKEEKNRVIKWIKGCEKPDIFDWMDGEAGKKIQGVVACYGCGLPKEISQTSSPPDNLLQLDYEFPVTADYLQIHRPLSGASSIETGGSVKLPGVPKPGQKRTEPSSDQDGTLHQPVSSIMTFNPTTHKYENPPPRWFNKDTGEYEAVKPMYFVDPTNPALGMVAPPRVSQEDAPFRQFLLDKEERRRIRVQREAEEAEGARRPELNPPPASRLKSHKTKEKLNASAEMFDDELAQRAFREITGTMFSKRYATAFLGPSPKKEEQQRQELEKRYRALKILVPSDAQIQNLPPVVDAQTILQAWRNSAAIRAKPKVKKPRLTEAERARALVRDKSGLQTGCTFAARQGSYIPPSSMMVTSSGTGWQEASTVGTGPRESRKEEEKQSDALKKVRGWRSEQLHSEAWWDRSERDGGRLAINPATGKLEDRGVPSATISKIQQQVQSKQHESIDLLAFD